MLSTLYFCDKRFVQEIGNKTRQNFGQKPSFDSTRKKNKFIVKI